MILEDALRIGEGIERPFQCHKHGDRQASASVNVLKGVWCCFACGAAGTVDGKKAPSVDDIEIMMEPESHCRVYPETYLELFANDLGNFAKRFPPWLRWHASLGCDPLTGDATFPVRSPSGLLAGVGRRRNDPGDGPRYVYPPRWSASRSLFVSGIPDKILVLVEGAGDASAVAETGAFCAGMYGSGLHKPQVDLVMRLAPSLVLIATDADEAGQLGAERAAEALSALTDTEFVDWSLLGVKDPPMASVDDRRELLAKTVVDAHYGEGQQIAEHWAERAAREQEQYRQQTVED